MDFTVDLDLSKMENVHTSLKRSFLVIHLTFLVRLLARKAIVMRIHQETLAKAEQNELRCLEILHSGPATVWCQFFF